jgi:hypothetical protein
MDNVEKHNSCINIQSSQIFKSYQQLLHQYNFFNLCENVTSYEICR